MKLLLSIVLGLTSIVAVAQTGPEAGGHEIQLWTGGGHSVPGGTSSTGVWNAGLRYGWILTEPHLPSVLRGRFEYAVDVVPAFVVFQPVNTTYGGGVNPINLKWDLAARGRFVPYLEISGGTLFSTREVPTGTSQINFTSGAAVGTHLIGSRHTLSLELRFMHISNAGLATPNPGINTVQLRVGIGKFLAPKAGN